MLLENCTTAPGVQEPPNSEQNLKFALSALLVCEKSESRFSTVFYYNLRCEDSPINLIFVVFRAPKGQLLPAQGSALGKGYNTIIAPCKGSYFNM